MKLFFLLIISSISVLTYSQQLFGDRCTGSWQGQMYIFNIGKVVDSVLVQFTVVPINDTAWTWRTDYLSPKMPLTKDYKLLYDKQTIYLTDEGDGVVLRNYCFANKLYSLFETDGITLTATYELIGETLVFEVTSGNKLEEVNGVSSYTVDFLQRVVFERIKR